METIARKNAKNHTVHCPVEVVTVLIGGKWKPVIMHQLLDKDILRFGELKKHLHGVTQKMLTNQLRELEKDGLINRKVYPEVPPKVEYSLTDLGLSLRPIIERMKTWGTSYLNNID